MLVYLIGLLIAVWYAVVARRSGGHPFGWPLLGLVSFFGSYWLWRVFFQSALVRDAETLAWFLVGGMVIGAMFAVIVLAALLQVAVARGAGGGAGGGEGTRPAPVIAPPPLDKWRYLTAFGVAVALALLSVVLQKQGAIQNEIGPGGMFPAGLAGVVGGVLVRRPLRSLVLGVGLGLAYAACYAPGLRLIGKLPLRGSEAFLGALIGLPLLMIIPAVAGGFLGAFCASAIDAIRVRARWLAERG